MKDLTQTGLRDLAEALTIMSRYGDSYAPTHCEHDILIVTAIDAAKVSEEDRARIEDLGFFVSKEYGERMFASFRFGSS